MRQVFKWTLAITDLQALSLPKGAQILSVQVQNELPQLWALVDPAAEKEKRTIAIYGTGHPVPDNPGDYIGTVQMLNGRLVWHIFAALDEPAKEWK